MRRAAAGRAVRGASRLVRDGSGIAAVEFAMVLPVLVVILFGTIEVGRMLTDFQVVSKSVRDTARFLAHADLTCSSTGSGPLSSYLVDASVQTEAINLAMSGSTATPGSGDYLLGYWTDPSTVSAQVDCIANGGQYAGAYQSRPYIPVITVTASVPLTFLFGSLVLQGTDLTMTASHSEIQIGP